MNKEQAIKDFESTYHCEWKEVNKETIKIIAKLEGMYNHHKVVFTKVTLIDLSETEETFITFSQENVMGLSEIESIIKILHLYYLKGE